MCGCGTCARERLVGRAGGVRGRRRCSGARGCRAPCPAFVAPRTARCRRRRCGRWLREVAAPAMPRRRSLSSSSPPSVTRAGRVGVGARGVAWRGAGRGGGRCQDDPDADGPRHPRPHHKPARSRPQDRQDLTLPQGHPRRQMIRPRRLPTVSPPLRSLVAGRGREKEPGASGGVCRHGGPSLSLAWGRHRSPPVPARLKGPQLQHPNRMCGSPRPGRGEWPGAVRGRQCWAPDRALVRHASRCARHRAPAFGVECVVVYQYSHYLIK